MTKTDAAVQTLSDINPDVVLEVNILLCLYPLRFVAWLTYYYGEISSVFLLITVSSILFPADYSFFLVIQSYTLNITTIEGFDTFMASLKNKSYNPNKQGSGVDLVLSCVDNYEARMAVNQVFIV